jgi:hypothetical protein
MRRVVFRRRRPENGDHPPRSTETDSRASARGAEYDVESADGKRLVVAQGE